MMVPSSPQRVARGRFGSDTASAPAQSAGSISPIPEHAKWGWALRSLSPAESHLDPRAPSAAPRVGDVIVVRIEKIGYHSSIVGTDNRKVHLYPGDTVVGVLGHRYATDAFEGEVDELTDLSLLTAGGMIGTVRSAHREMGRSTSVTFVGSVVGADGEPINLKGHLFHPVATGMADGAGPLLVVVGTGMNAGKTTVVAQTLHGLHRQGLRVAAGKLTGSVSNRDVDEMRSAHAVSVVDFSDYGFPSTYLSAPGELSALGREILAVSAARHPDLTVLEIADGVLQRETAMILRDPEFRERVSGVLLAADSPLAALGALQELRTLGYSVLGVSGAITSSPLYVREFEARSNVPVLPSTGVGTELAQRVRDGLAGLGERAAPAPTLSPAA